MAIASPTPGTATQLTKAKEPDRRSWTGGRLARRLSRVTTSGQFIPEIDGLRFVAIASVFLFHLNGYLLERSQVHFSSPPRQDWLANIAFQGFRGVPLFFIISGFILALPFAAHTLKDARPVKLRSYFLRRVTRLEPPYIVTTLVLFVLMVVTKHESARANLPHLLASLVYLHNAIFGVSSPVIGVAWSLEIEIQFYLLVPLLAQVFTIRNTIARRSVIGGTALVAMALQSLFNGDHPRADLSILNFIQFFLMGFLLADLFLTTWNERPRQEWAWDAITLTGWPVLYLAFHNATATHWFFPPLALLLYSAVFRGHATNAVFRTPTLTVIGGMCYTIYLIHYEVISLVGRFSKLLVFTNVYWINLVAQFFVVGFFAVVICGAYFLVLERPCMRRDWPQRLLACFRQTGSTPDLKSDATTAG